MSSLSDSCENNPTYQILKKGVIEIGEMLIAMQQSGNLHASQKENFHSIVTAADKKSESEIIALLKNNFPESAILSEESLSENHADTFWVIDPIDGTSFFEHGLRDWTITIAYVEEKKIKIGLTYCPLTKEFFFAEAGKGAFLNGKRIHVSKRTTLESSIISIGTKIARTRPGIYEIFSTKVRSVWTTGSTALALASIAAGRLDAMVQIEQAFWDIAAGIILINEAGGRFTNWQGGEDFDMSGAYSKENTFIASNGLLHQAISKLL